MVPRPWTHSAIWGGRAYAHRAETIRQTTLTRRSLSNGWLLPGCRTWKQLGNQPRKARLARSPLQVPARP
jgi:hypothetical protein